MRARHAVPITMLAALASLSASGAGAGVTVFFDPGQVAAVVDSGPTWDRIRSTGYLFTYTRDKLFTGGGSVPIGRPVLVNWPDGVEAQYVTAGPLPDKATITIQRVDGGVFDLTSFTAQLLANAGAGRAIEVVPMLNGQEPFADPFSFDVSGSTWQQFSYDTSPNPLGSTAALVGFDTYVMRLTLDYALRALTLTDPSTSSVGGPARARAAGPPRVAPNPAGCSMRIDAAGDGAGGRWISVLALDGSLVRSLALDAAGRTTWDLRDAGGRRVVPGVYFVRSRSESGSSATRRVVVLK